MELVANANLQREAQFFFVLLFCFTFDIGLLLDIGLDGYGLFHFSWYKVIIWLKF